MFSTTNVIEECLIEATTCAFERMCFAVVEPTFDVLAIESPIEGFVSFDGDATGDLHIRLDRGAARMIASSFLGEDPDSLSRQQTEEVVSELANVICGSMLSLLSTNGEFTLSTRIAEVIPTDLLTVQQAFRGDAGGFSITIRQKLA